MTEAPGFPPILDDLPTGTDALDFAPYVDALSDILLDPNTHTPLTLGLFGSWGSGKTSLMTMLRDCVRGETDTGDKPDCKSYANSNQGERLVHRTVWFNAWKYDKEDALWRALLLVLLDDLAQLLEEDPPESVEGEPEPEKLLDMLREALYHETSWTEQGERNINWTQALTAGAGLAFNLILSNLVPGPFAIDTLAAAREKFGEGEPVSQVGKLAEAFRREELVHYQAQLRSLEQFQRNFERLVKLLLQRPGQQPRRLIVFVDDLDRCVADKAISVLEALKLFLDVKGCLFVLALDNEAIQDAIRRRYPDQAKAGQYLDKIIQVPFTLPPIEADDMRAYVDSLASTLPDSRCAEVFAVGLTPNPRQVKRTLNIFLLLSRLVEHRPVLEEAITLPRLAKMVAIQHAHPDLYTLVRLTPRYLSDLEAYFRRAGEDKRPGQEDEDMPQLPEALSKFSASRDLRRLFLSIGDEDARFDNLRPEALRSYVTLTRQAVSTSPALRIARLPFEPELVPVAAGSFLMGTSDEQIKAMLERYDWAKEFKEKGWFDREQPQHEVTLAAYHIGRYPVTNAEYAAFVEATGHDAPNHWSGGQMPEQRSDHPVVNVSWRDAIAYVEWLRERSEHPYRLPTEAEWEKAARGEDGRLWPWGNVWEVTRANCKPDGPGETTPVGQYPDGVSPYGCYDMAGNVWEWCSSLLQDYPYRPDDGRENLDDGGDRILRGGSWYGPNASRVRCAGRDGGNPVSRYGRSGFRVARGSLK